VVPPISEDQIGAFAHQALSKSLRLRRGENLIVETWSASIDWANALALEARKLRARPLVFHQDEATYWKAVSELPTAELGRVGSHEWAALKATDAYVYLYGPSDTQREDSLGSARFRQLTAYDDEWFRIAEKQRVRAVRFDIGRTNAKAARQFGLDLEAWQQELVRASLVDIDAMRAEGQKVARAFQTGRSIRVVHPNGTDLELGLKGRRPRVHDGVVDARDLQSGDFYENLPSGWVVTALDERRAEGTILSNSRVSVSSMAQGHVDTGPAEGVKWTFQGGRLSSFEFERGGDEFRQVYSKMGPGRDRPAAITIGLNPEIKTLPRMDDQRRGCVTVAIGRNTYLDGTTHTPYFHGYVHVDGADVWIDGRPLLRAGEFI
jgi:leucyl aminopeptidase (aminopeptidase T)